MIRQYKESDIQFMNSEIKADIFQNPYLYIDTHIYGYEIKKDIMTWVVEHEDTINIILYKYYNSLQIFETTAGMDQQYSEICSHILKQDYEMVSGKLELIKRLYLKLMEDYEISSGCIMSICDVLWKQSNSTQWATKEQCGEIAELICSDINIGGHYSVELLKDQLIDRMNNRNCKNLVLVHGEKIVTHMATYADIDDMAILGGLVTDPAYRHKGYGKKVLNDITYSIIAENKKPVLFCYNTELIKWYQSQGWDIVTECAKLEKRR